MSIFPTISLPSDIRNNYSDEDQSWNSTNFHIEDKMIEDFVVFDFGEM